MIRLSPLSSIRRALVVGIGVFATIPAVASAVDPPEDPQLAEICGRDAPNVAPTASPGGGARFVIDASGRLTIHPDADADALHVAAPAGIVRIDVVDLDDPSRSRLAFCARTANATVGFSIADLAQSSRGRRRILRIGTYRAPTSSSERAFVDGERTRRRAALAASLEPDVVLLVRHEIFAGAEPSLLSNLSAFALGTEATREATLEALRGALTTRRDALSVPVSSIGCVQSASSADPVVLLECEARRVVLRELDALLALLPPPRTNPPQANRARDVHAAVVALQARIPESEILAAPTPRTCMSNAIRRWLTSNNAGTLLPLDRVEIPLDVRSSELLEIAFVRGVTTAALNLGASSTQGSPYLRGGIVVGDAPRDEPVVFRQTLGEEDPQTWQALLDRAFPLALKVLSGVAGFATTTDFDYCPTPGNEERAFAIDPEFRPMRATVTRAYVTEPFPDTHRANVDVCTSGCGESLTRLRVPLRNVRRFAPSVSLEVGLNVFGFVTGNDRGYSGVRHFYSSRHYEAVGGAFGPEQTFELRYDVELERLIAFNALIGVRFSGRHVLAMGPTLVDAAGNQTFTQWNVRYGRRISEGVDFTIGVTVARTDVQREPLPERVVVARPTQGDIPSAPGFARTHRPSIGLTLGVAFDAFAFASLWKKAGGT